MCSILLDSAGRGPDVDVLESWEDQAFWDAVAFAETTDVLLDSVPAADVGATGLRAATGPWERLSRVLPLGEPGVDEPGCTGHLGLVDDEVLLARLGEVEALVTQLGVAQGRLLAELRTRRLSQQAAAHGHDVADCPAGACCDPDGWLPMEASLVMGLSERQVRSRLATAQRCQRYAATAAVMGQGRLQSWTATVLLDHLDTLGRYVGPVEVAEVEAAALAWLAARPRTVAALNARMRRVLVAARAAFDAARAAAAEQTEQGDVDGAAADLPDLSRPDPAAAERCVTVAPGRTPGMSELVAMLPEADALAVHATLTALAGVCAEPGDARSVAQRRADLLVTLVTGLPGREGRVDDLDHAVRDDGALLVHLDLTVPAVAPTGTSPASGDVTGYGPVPVGTVRDLVSAATSGTGRPLLIDPASGCLIGFGSRPVPLTWLADLAPGSGYQHPRVMDTAIRLRDRTCRAPGCRRAAARCDCDHVIPYPQGGTSLANSCCLCRRHHRLKTHAPGWHVEVGPHGELTWTTPAGDTTETQPHDYRAEPFPRGSDATAEPDVPPF